LTEGPDGGNQWILSTFITDCLPEDDSQYNFQENPADMRTGRRFRTLFKESPFPNSAVKSARISLLLHEAQLWLF
jgi:hypothetical protein